MLMYGYVVHKRVSSERWCHTEDGRGGHEAGCRSTSQSGLPSVRAPPRDADGFLFRCGPRDVVPSHCRPAFFICIQSPETSARHRPSSPPWLRFLPRSITPAETHSRLPASSSSSRSPLRRCIHRDINAAVCRNYRRRHGEKGSPQVGTARACSPRNKESGKEGEKREAGFWIKDDV